MFSLQNCIILVTLLDEKVFIYDETSHNSFNNKMSTIKWLKAKKSLNF